MMAIPIWPSWICACSAHCFCLLWSWAWPLAYCRPCAWRVFNPVCRPRLPEEHCMSLRTVWAPLRRHGLMPALVFMQVTLACAILSNVLFLSWQKLEPMLASTGVDAANLVLIDNLASMQRAFTANDSDSAEQALRNTPGVRAASSALGLPMVGMMVYAANLHGANGVT